MPKKKSKALLLSRKNWTQHYWEPLKPNMKLFVGAPCVNQPKSNRDQVGKYAIKKRAQDELNNAQTSTSLELCPNPNYKAAENQAEHVRGQRTMTALHTLKSNKTSLCVNCLLESTQENTWFNEHLQCWINSYNILLCLTGLIWNGQLCKKKKSC